MQGDVLRFICATNGWWLVCAMFGCVGVAHAGLLEGVRMHEAPNYTRVVFDTSERVEYKIFVLTNPHRVVIDLNNTSAELGFDPSVVAVGRERLKGLRAAQRGAGYRVVLDTYAKLTPKGFTLEPVAPYGHRLVVDLYSVTPRPVTPPSVPDEDGQRDVIVAIDAGHGGEDPGASGVGRTQEKKLVLNIARKLAYRLNRARGYKAVLVRTGDYYVAHRKRTRIARDQRADLFVSLHADAFESPEVSGASVYALSDRRASSETARWLADKENRSDLIGGVGEVSLDDKDDLVARVLVDISMDANLAASIEVGESVLNRLAGVAKMHKSRVEQAGFVVLTSPDMSSILVEMGFISNPNEARRLNQSSYQEQLASALFDGIRDYMGRSAPPGTLISWQRNQRKVNYTIARGDTLSGIANRYGTSSRRIREANNISGDNIRIGQVIVIPAG
ncbi:MAG: N-acetylmuramoyl-L-alanine amidase [Gammaproteobacteria bacterium]|nr:N-acetylmuramoyl-L-alanine amidase [Gammaproteobacteria bacterium]